MCHICSLTLGNEVCKGVIKIGQHLWGLHDCPALLTGQLWVVFPQNLEHPFCTQKHTVDDIYNKDVALWKR